LDYYIWLAKLAEKGKITGIFFADVYGVGSLYSPVPPYNNGELAFGSCRTVNGTLRLSGPNTKFKIDDTFPGQFEAQFKSGSNCAQLDPIVFVSAMAAVTKSVCFGITGSTSYINVRPHHPILNNNSNLYYSLSFWLEPTPHSTMLARVELRGTW
jgi:alkanesulfonate monooxygenase SsuD/methylene tetrahydromethanopterin reductase-like flavin-dependent oxidoreductase (luciferase family)